MSNPCIISGRLPSDLRTSERKLFRSSFSPYRAGMGPTFEIVAYDAYTVGGTHSHLSIELTVRENGNVERFSFVEWVGIPGHQSIDGRAAKEACWTAVAMRPGDTDPDFFTGYPEALLEIVTAHGSYLSYEIATRYADV